MKVSDVWNYNEKDWIVEQLEFILCGGNHIFAETISMANLGSKTDISRTNKIVGTFVILKNTNNQNFYNGRWRRE